MVADTAVNVGVVDNTAVVDSIDSVVHVGERNHVGGLDKDWIAE